MANSRMPSESEFLEWQSHPVTIRLFERLRADKESLKERWASGAYTDQSQFGTAIMNAKAIGNCEAIDSITTLEYEQLLGESDEQHERAAAPGQSGSG